jgi:phosphoserine phosphatase RsbU/P
MNDHTVEINALASTLADSFDQIVFLERAVQHITSCETLEDVLPILEEARRAFGAEQAALYVAGQNLTPVPRWLSELAEHRVIMMRPALIVPFQDGWSAFWGRERDFGAPERKIAETLGRLITGLYRSLEFRREQHRIALEEHEQRLASRLWRTIMLERQGQLTQHLWQAWYEPAREVGGDFYLADGEWVVVGDISGKGLAAAMLSGMFQAATKVALRQTMPSLALEQALFADFTRTGMFCTLFAARFFGNGEMGYLNMGHPAALILKPSGIVRRLPASSMPFGILPLGNLALTRISLEPNDILVMFTDGVTEASQLNTLYGEDRLIYLLQGCRQPSEVIEKIRTALQDWKIQDDVCVVAVQYVPDKVAVPHIPDQVTVPHIPDQVTVPHVSDQVIQEGGVKLN